MSNVELSTLLAILLPIILLQWGLNIVALIDLIHRPAEQVRHLPKWAWAVIIVMINFIGAIAYMVAGREEA